MSARLLMACLLATWIGCGKRPTSSPPPPEPAAARDVAPTNPSTGENAPAAMTPVDEAEIAAVLNGLTQAVRKYSVEQRRVPKTLEEVAANGYLSRVPQAPAGKKFAINKDLQVYLANR